MERQHRNPLAAGVILILLGLVFLAAQFMPGLGAWLGVWGWPMIVIAVGVGLLLIGVLTDQPGMAVPACIVGGIGLLLMWQNSTQNWQSWAYAWTLIPGFAGLGTLLAGLWSGDRRAVTGGASSMLVSLILFAIFASFLGGFNLLGNYWPLLLIALGAVLLVRSLLRRQS